MQASVLVYIQQDNQTLMLHRVKKQQDVHEGKWNGLGGKVEQGECPEEAVIREIHEEVGLRVDTLQFKGMMTVVEGEQEWIVHIYLVTKFSGEIQECNEGDIARIDNDKLLELNLRESDKHFVPLLFQPGRFSCKAVYVDNELADIIVHRYL